MAASMEMDTSQARAPSVQWPSLPFFLPLTVPLSGPECNCELELSNRRVVHGELARFETGCDTVTLQLTKPLRTQQVNLDLVRCIRLTTPVMLVADERALHVIGARADHVAQPKPFEITMRGGTPLTGQTRSFIKNDDGLFLFLVEGDADTVVRCFVPARQIADLQIGPLLGETLVEQSLVSPEAMDKALGKQSKLRQQRIGEYLTDRAIITAEELAQAVANQKTRPNVRIGDVLLDAGVITPVQLQEALAIQSKQRERRIGDILIEMGAASLRTVQMALSEKLGIPYVNAKEFKVDPLTLELVEASFAVRHQVLPLLRSGESLIVAVENPLAITFAQDLRVTAGLFIVPVIADPAELKLRIAKEYPRLDGRIQDLSGSGGGRDSARPDLMKVQDLALQLSRETPQPALSSKGRESDTRVSDNTLVRLVNKMIVDAHSQGASDIHIESNPGQIHTRIRFRRDGDLEDYLELPPAYRNSLVSRIKVMAELDISEHRHPQDGKIDFGKFGPLAIELRIAIVPTANNLEDVVLRLLGGMEPVPLANMGFSSRDLTEINRMIGRSYGLVLVCGPTGSGKTTTLHSILNHVNSPDMKIWTAEDPIEITQPGLRQVQVQPKIDWTFAAAMRAFLRADPDVIMVGEMRDAETTKIGIEASLTGHLVFSTLHTNSAAESVVRLLDLGMDPFNFADALLGILSQRLARTLCKECKRGRIATEEELAELALEYCGGTQLEPAAVLNRWQETYGRADGIELHEAVGCQACREGYKGRLGVYELLSGTPELKHLIRTRAPVPQLVEVAQADGMHLLRQDAIEKVLSGALDLVSARAVAS